MVFDPPGPRRSSLRWLVPIILVVVALVAVAGSNTGRNTRGELEYLDRIAEQSERLALGGDALRDVVSRLSRIDRPEFVTAIDNLRAEIAVGMELVAEEPPSVELFAVQSLYALALENWSSGVGGFANGILLAADNPDDTTPTDTIANAIVELRSGDQLFLEMIGEMDRADVPEPVKTVRVVVLSLAPGEAIQLATAYTEAARSENNGLALRPGLAASQIVAEPDWQLSPENLPVMPTTEEAVFSVIVSNVGNLVSMEEELALTLTPIDGGDPVTVAALIPPLEPGAQTTVPFDPIPVTPGESFEVAVIINVRDVDSSFEDNEIRVLFKVNSE